MTVRGRGVGKFRLAGCKRPFFWLAGRKGKGKAAGMKWLPCAASVIWFAVCSASASTISVVPVFQPLTLHGTDVDGALLEVGEALQATVLARPMALSGAFPEDIVTAIKMPHQLPTNTPNYKVTEANLVILCGLDLSATLGEEGLAIVVDATRLQVPAEIDLTEKQVVKLLLVAVRKTLEAHHGQQVGGLRVSISISGAEGPREGLKELESKFTIEGADLSR